MRSARTVQAVVLLVAVSLAESACQAGADPSRTSSGGATPTAGAPTSPPETAAATDISSGGSPVHLVKDCSTFNAEIPSFCEISSSDYAAIPVGAKVAYLGPLPDNPHFLSSNVLIDDAHGNQATGYCIFDGRPTEERGFCTFWAGTGALSHFTAIFKVSIDAVGEWHLDGEYYGTTPSPGPS